MNNRQKIIRSVVVFVASLVIVSLCWFAWFASISPPLPVPIQLSISILLGTMFAGSLAWLIWKEFWKGYWKRIKNAPRSRVIFNFSMFIFSIAVLLFVLND